jgi:hypothetical protein
MSTTGSHRTTHGDPGDVAYGVSIFAGVLLACLASMQILEGLSAVLKDSIFVSGLNYTYEIDITTWGWIHMLLGAGGVVVGVSIVTGQVWAYVVGIGLAAVSALSQFLFMPYYPLWSLVILALNIFVIWALTERIRKA